jgi:DNA-binding IscR family transcriptional regulator
MKDVFYDDLRGVMAALHKAGLLRRVKGTEGGESWQRR